jgi:hypothetical protein
VEGGASDEKASELANKTLDGDGGWSKKLFNY